MEFKNIYDELQNRKILKACTNQNKLQACQQQAKAVYCGFDLTAPSLHIGNLIPLFTLKRFCAYRFKVIVVLGGMTSMIGDPSGKKYERTLMAKHTITKNKSTIKAQIKKIVPEAKILDNESWWKDISLVQFLRQIGKHFKLNNLINLQVIRDRIKNGISLTEFSYNLIQSYDFYYLYKNYDCCVQIGGSDQWGNITSGIKFIKSKLSFIHNQATLACGVTTNLLINKDQTKFGKTEKGTIWLDRNATSPFAFWQFFFNQSDESCNDLLKIFTFLKVNAIECRKYVLQEKQKLLANYTTLLIHGRQALDEIHRINEALFKNQITKLTKQDFQNIEQGIAVYPIDHKGDHVNQILVQNKIIASNREWRELINQNALKLNGHILTQNDNKPLHNFPSLFEKYYLLKKGKKKYFLLKKV